MAKKKRPQDISKIEKDKRINAVHTLILQGATNSQIIQYCAKEFKVEERATYIYIGEARDEMKRNFLKTEDADLMKSEIFSRLENLYQQNMDIEDLKECRNVLKDIREMLGLNAPQKRENLNIDLISPEEKIKRLQKLKDQINNAD